MKGNVIVGQSGGPTAAINSSLAGVYRTARDRGAGKVYGMLHGIQAVSYTHLASAAFCLAAFTTSPSISYP